MLEIRKKSPKHFRHYYGNFKPFSSNDITIIFDGNDVKLRSVSGRVIFLKDGFNVLDVRLYDDTDSGTVESFPNIQSLVARLVQLGYPFLGNDNEIIDNGTTWDAITGLPETNGNLVTYIINQLSPLETDISNIESDINDINNDISNIETDITNINDDITDINTELGNKLDTVQAGTNITIDDSDPNNPVISSTGGDGTLLTSNKVITLSLQDIGATDFEDDVKTKMLAYLQSEGVTIEAGVMPVIELNDVFSYNFEIEADWTANSVTDETSFVTFMDNAQDGSGVTVTDFVLEGNRIRCNLSNSDAPQLGLSSKGISEIISIGEWDSLTRLDLESNQLTEFNPSIALPSSLKILNLNSNQLTEFNPSIALPSGLIVLNLKSNLLTEFNPSIALPSGLIVLDLISNQLTEFNPSIALPSGLNLLNLNSNQLTEFNPSIALPSSLTVLNLNSNQLTEFNPSIALPSSLNGLYLISNLLTEFNPSIALPSSLTVLYLKSNLLTTTSYTNAETWANAQPEFTSNCEIYFNNNTDSITGTNLETILLTKNVTITA